MASYQILAISTAGSLYHSNKRQNLGRSYEQAIERLHDLRIMINGSFVFGLDGDDPHVFDRTVEWAVKRGITTSTFHIATPYPGAVFYQDMKSAGLMTTDNWDLFDTRHLTFTPAHMAPKELKDGYEHANKCFYEWGNIAKASLSHGRFKHQVKHFFYTSGWKKFVALWNFAIQMKWLDLMTPLLEGVLSKVTKNGTNPSLETTPSNISP